jgi:hypothetical protein
MDHTFSHDVLVDGVKRGNQFLLATVVGVAMALICALIWPAVAFFAGPKLDCLALGVGALVGLSIRFSGKGTTPIYGVLAMVLALISSLVGNILGVITSGSHDQFDIFAVAQRVNLPDVVMSILSQATLMTYLIFAAGVALSYLVAVRR